MLYGLVLSKAHRRRWLARPKLLPGGWRGPAAPPARRTVPARLQQLQELPDTVSAPAEWATIAGLTHCGAQHIGLTDAMWPQPALQGPGIAH